MKNKMLKKIMSVFIASLMLVSSVPIFVSASSNEESVSQLVSEYVEQIGDGIYKINEYDCVYMYLIVGEKRALLIDTGVGLFDLKGIVEEITDLPLTVVLTHNHVDHAGGAAQFEQVLCPQNDINMTPATLSYRRSFMLTQVVSSADMSDVIDWGKDANLVVMADNASFDLGGRTVKSFATPGHTKGSTSYLDSKTKILIGGDNTGMVILDFLPNCDTVQVLLNTYNKLLSMKNDVSAIYGGHTGSTPLSFDAVEGLRDMTQSALNSRGGKNSRMSLILVQLGSGSTLIYKSNNVI